MTAVDSLDVSVVVPTFNRRERLLRRLHLGRLVVRSDRLAAGAAISYSLPLSPLALSSIIDMRVDHVPPRDRICTRTLP